MEKEFYIQKNKDKNNSSFSSETIQDGKQQSNIFKILNEKNVTWNSTLSENIFLNEGRGLLLLLLA